MDYGIRGLEGKSTLNELESIQLFAGFLKFISQYEQLNFLMGAVDTMEKVIDAELAKRGYKLIMDKKKRDYVFKRIGE